jgi:hypothetical protein
MSSFIQGLFSPGNTVDPLVARMAGQGSSPDGPIIPKRVLLSSECYILFESPLDYQNLDLVQVDSITKTKRFIEKKNFKPFGHEDNIVLIDDAGWDIRVSARKTDANLSKFIYLQELYLRRNNGISKMKPMFEIREKFLYGVHTQGKDIRPDITEIYVYKDVSIVGFDEEIAGNASEIRYNLQMFSPRRFRPTPAEEGEFSFLTNSPNFVITSANAPKDRVSNIIDELLAKNLQ